MKKELLKLIITLSILIIIPYSCITALGKMEIDWTTEGDKALYAHPEFVSIEEEWGEKLGTHYIVNLTENRILEFAQINSGNGGGKYAGLRRIGEFIITGQVEYKKDEYHSWKDEYGSHVRFQDLSQLLGIEIETMTDCIDNYDKIFQFVQNLARDEYIAGYEESIKIARKGYDNQDIIQKFPNHFVLSKDRKAMIAVSFIYGYPRWVWDGIQEEELKQCKNWVNEFGENWENNVPYDKIRKSLGLE